MNHALRDYPLCFLVKTFVFHLLLQQQCFSILDTVRLQSAVLKFLDWTDTCRQQIVPPLVTTVALVVDKNSNNTRLDTVVRDYCHHIVMYMKDSTLQNRMHSDSGDWLHSRREERAGESNRREQKLVDPFAIT